MLTILFALLTGLLGGIVAGGCVSRWLLRRHLSRLSPDSAAIDPELDRQITEAAWQWAESHGRASAAPLVANRLRLAYVLKQGRTRRRRWRRSR
jgi:hypothetical protein